MVSPVLSVPESLLTQRQFPTMLTACFLSIQYLSKGGNKVVFSRPIPDYHLAQEDVLVLIFWLAAGDLAS